MINSIRAHRIWTPEGWLEDHVLIIEQGRIQGVQRFREFGDEPLSLDASHDTIIPGLIDLQVNGALGHSFQATDHDHYETILHYHLQAGTTTLLPTIITAPQDTLSASLTWLAEHLQPNLPMTLPGIHLEGPFLAAEKSGAHDPSTLCAPHVDLTQALYKAAQGQLRMFTLAPELPGADAVIRYLVENDVIVAAGHSAAHYADMAQAVEAGLSFITHMGNASDWPHRAQGMQGFMTSEPGVVGAYMALPQLGGSVIMDGFHFHPKLLKPLVQLKGPDRLVLVSDASTVAGCNPGYYASGGLEVEVHSGGYATSGRGGGWLAGSTITLFDAVQRAVTLADLPLHTAVRLATLTPATYLGLQARKGHLQAGADADFLVIDSDLKLRDVFANGKLVTEHTLSKSERSRS